MKNMNVKKMLSYAIVGASSAIVTLGIFSFGMNKFSDVDSTIQTEKPKTHFTSTSYSNAPSSAVDLTIAAEKTINSVVSIKNYSSKKQQRQNSGNFIDPFEFFFGQPQEPREQQRAPEDMPSGLGSGVIISVDGYIVTNNHVISGADKIEVTLNNQKSYVAKLIGTDPSTDIALIKIDEVKLPFLNFYNSENAKIGEWVLAVGNPFGLTSTVTAGIISAKARSLDLFRSSGISSPVESFIQTDAAVNPGNSGGALVNTNGDLIGINTAIASHSGTGTFEGYSFAVPSNIAKKIVEDIKKYGIVQRGYLGVSVLDLSDSEKVKDYNIRNKTDYKARLGVLVLDVQDDGGAKDAGLKKNDIITKIDGFDIKNFATLSGIIGERRPGDKVNVVAIRDGKDKNFSVKLKDAKGNTKIKTKADMSAIEKLGGSFKPLSDRLKVNYGLESGVLVTEVEPGGKLASIGINSEYIILDINNKAVNNEADIEKILKNYKGNVSLRYVDPYGRMYKRGFTFEE